MLQGYIYSEKTNEYVGTTIIMVDPLESQKAGKEVLAFPPNCTLVPPSEVGEHEVAIFNPKTEVWGVEKDFRGCTVYSRKGTPVVIEEIGDIPTNYLLEKPVTLQEIKADKIEEIRAVCNKLLGEVVGTEKIRTTVSKRNELLNFKKGFGTHAVLPYTDSEGEVVFVTEAEVEEAEKYLYIYEMLVARAKNNLLSEIKACTNKKAASDLEVKVDINKKLKELMKLSDEEVNEYFVGEE